MECMNWTPGTLRADPVAVKALLARAEAQRADAQYFVARLELEAARARALLNQHETASARAPLPW